MAEGVASNASQQSSMFKCMSNEFTHYNNTYNQTPDGKPFDGNYSLNNCVSPNSTIWNTTSNPANPKQVAVAGSLFNPSKMGIVVEGGDFSYTSDDKTDTGLAFWPKYYNNTYTDAFWAVVYPHGKTFNTLWADLHVEPVSKDDPKKYYYFFDNKGNY